MVSRIILFVAVGLIFSAKTKAAEPCTVRDQKIVDAFPAFRSQDGTDYCYAFAAVAVLEQWNCHRQHGRNCVPPSTLDANRMANGGRVVNIGYAADVLEVINQHHSILPESCASFDQMTKAYHYQFRKRCELKQSSEFNWMNRASNMFSSAKKTKLVVKHSKDPCETASAFKKYIGLRSPVEQIAWALESSDSVESFLGRAAIPQDCEKKAITLPSFSVAEYKMTTDESLAKALRENILRDQMTGVNICIISMKEGCRAHAFAIGGIRTRCCGNRCDEEYKLADSLDLSWLSAQEKIQDSWAPAGKIREMTLEAVKPAGSAEYGPNIWWIRQ